MSASHPSQRISRGFEKIDRDRDRLLTLFAEVLRDLGSPKIAASLPWVGENFDRPDPEIDPVDLCQATSIAFHLLNIVEENASNQMRRYAERTGSFLDESGLWGWYLQRLQGSGQSALQIREAFSQTEVVPVLTAHPTESKRITVLEQHRELYLLLVELENSMYSPTEHREIEDRIRAVLERLWRTGETLLEKPTVAAERNALLHYLNNVFPKAIRSVDQHYREAWEAVGFDPALLDSPSHFPKLRFGTWVGGDRDGHPLVTPEVTRETLTQLRIQALRLQHSNLDRLRAELSISSLLVESAPAFTEALGAKLRVLGAKGESIADRNPAEPWRQFVSAMMARLPSEERTLPSLPDAAYRNAQELADDLYLLRKALPGAKRSRLAAQYLDPVIRSVETFGFHLAKLDLRQNSDFHDRAIEQILKGAGFEDVAFSKWNESQRLEFLNHSLNGVSPLLPLSAYNREEAGLAVGALREVFHHFDQFGPEGIGVYIVSMTRSLSDLVAVYFLAREAGLLFQTDYGVVCRLPISPLFETIDDLKGSAAILDAFITHPITQATLAWRRKVGATSAGQIDVMIGYSDSNKDGGIIASQWTLYRSQERLAAVGQAHGLDLRFFHGRGGTISRGAGPTHRFIEALPPQSVGRALRITEQGETIAQKYSNLLTASHHLDLLLSGTAYRNAAPGVSSDTPSGLVPVLDAIAAKSKEVYQGLLHTEGFMSFYRSATPIDLLESSRIGSRPSRRTGASSIADLRAIPWVFSWSQSRFFLPGWFGVGSALEAILGESTELEEKFRAGLSNWPFLKYILTNIEMSSLSADPLIFTKYADLVSEKALRDRFVEQIEGEWNLTRGWINRLFGSEALKRRPRLTKTLVPRAEAIRPLHDLQIRLLREWRDACSVGDEKTASALHPHLLLSVNAISSGLRTTG
ncbi:MAG: phosphoenolpyruvate carboxylase [Puniceicoccaceae bacterium]